MACDSELNRDDLSAFGLPPERLSVLHLPAAGAQVPRLRSIRRGPGQPVELLFLGRFVRAKGVLDLLEATRLLLESGAGPFPSRWPATRPSRTPLSWRRSSRPPRNRRERSVSLASPADAELRELMAGSDVLVMPSYHEGYCLPVIEAYAEGCQVTANDAGNLPNVVGGLGLLVPTGDTSALAKALATQIDAISGIGNGGAAMVPTTAGWWPGRHVEGAGGGPLGAILGPCVREAAFRACCSSRRPGRFPVWLRCWSTCGKWLIFSRPPRRSSTPRRWERLLGAPTTARS